MITTTHDKITLHTPDELWVEMAMSKDNLLHVTFGRMNPPTDAHLDLLMAMDDMVNMGTSSSAVVYLSETQDMSNPLTVGERAELLAPFTSVFAVELDSAANMFNAMSKADELAQERGARGIVWWIGSDRLEAAKRLWLYPDHWKTPLVRIVELIRLPEDDRSATAMRAAALNSDYETFERLAGTTVNQVQGLFDKLRSRLTDGSLESKTKTAK